MDVLHVAIEVTDLEAMRGFYEDLLGLHHTREHETRGHRNYYVAGSGSTELQFRVVDEPVEPSDIDHIAIACEDVDAVVERAVEEYDSEIIREPESLTRKPIRLAEITDPEGYTVHLIEDEDR